MDFIKQWTLNICLTLIIAVIFSMLSPKGNMGKYFKIVIALFITVSFIYPIAESNIDLSSEFSSLYGFAQEQENYEDTYKKLIENQIKALLEENGYESCLVSSRLKIDNEEIMVEEISISVPDSYNTEEIKNLIYEKLGFAVQVKYIGE
ncbi:MAG: hypothetical protein ACI4IK_06820 [Eubacterium sp.]